MVMIEVHQIWAIWYFSKDMTLILQ